ncbi:MAG: hypothetical protein LUF02_04305 [Erysipelotrichaceae bacterium]|nr:hypothetical protein [Erysipelotrichaceae bacterium]
MLIEVKGINDALLMKFNENCSFDSIITELNMLLDQPIFASDGYYPRAYFDFGCRFLKEGEFYCLLNLLFHKKRVLFQGLSLPVNKNSINVVYQTIHCGEEIHVYEDTLFLSAIHPGSYVFIENTAFFLNTVQGHIIAKNQDVRIYGQQFYDATIMINNAIIHHLTTSAMSSVYYKDGHIVLKEDEYEQDYSHYIR